MHLCCEIFIIYYLKCLLLCSTDNMLQNFEKTFYKKKTKTNKKLKEEMKSLWKYYINRVR